MNKGRKLDTLLLLATGAVLLLASCASMTLTGVDPSHPVTGPSRVRQGAEIDPNTVTIWAQYKDGSVKEERSKTIIFDSHIPGKQTVKVQIGLVNTFMGTFETEVMALRTLTVSSMPRKVVYKQGEELDTAGLQIWGEWDQMGGSTVDLKLCEITGYNPNDAGNQAVKVVYENIQTTFDVTVVSMAGIQIVNTPEKYEYFKGEPLDLKGLQVVGKWGDFFPDEKLTVSMDNITGYNPSNGGIQHVTVTVNGMSAVFDVEVLQLVRLEIRRDPTHAMDYKPGEALDLTGITVWAQFAGSDAAKTKEILYENPDDFIVKGYDPNLLYERQKPILSLKAFPEITTQSFTVRVLPDAAQ